MKRVIDTGDDRQEMRGGGGREGGEAATLERREGRKAQEMGRCRREEKKGREKSKEIVERGVGEGGK